MEGKQQLEAIVESMQCKNWTRCKPVQRETKPAMGAMVDSWYVYHLVMV